MSAEVQTLTPGATRVLAAIEAHGFNGPEACPSQDLLAAELGYTRRHVNRCVRELLTAGRVAVRKERRPGAKWTHNVYTVACWSPRLRSRTLDSIRRARRVRGRCLTEGTAGPTRAQTDVSSPSWRSFETKKRLSPSREPATGRRKNGRLRNSPVEAALAVDHVGRRRSADRVALHRWPEAAGAPPGVAPAVAAPTVRQATPAVATLDVMVAELRRVEAERDRVLHAFRGADLGGAGSFGRVVRVGA